MNNLTGKWLIFISSGKKSLMLGLVELFGFVRALQDMHSAVIRGVSVEYGSQTKGTNVAQSMGWTKPRNRLRHTAVNDRRAPDTTDALAGQSSPRLPKKLGRPPGARNIEKNPFTTYPSYSASKNPLQRNRCWMAAALKTLYAMYNPLWM